MRNRSVNDTQKSSRTGRYQVYRLPCPNWSSSSCHLLPKVYTSMDKAIKSIFPIQSRAFQSFEGLRKWFLYNFPHLPRRIIVYDLSSRMYRDFASEMSWKQFYLTHSSISAPLVFSPLQGLFCLETLWSLDNFKKFIGELNNALSKIILSGISGDDLGR